MRQSHDSHATIKQFTCDETRHLCNQLHVLYMFSDINSELYIKCHNICCLSHVLTNYINLVHTMSHSMCPLLVGGCVGPTKTYVLQNTMLVGYQQWYW